MVEPPSPPTPPPQRQSLGRSLLAVAWSLLGVRKGSEWERDAAQIQPLHVVVVGLVAIFGLVIGLMLVVNWVV